MSHAVLHRIKQMSKPILVSGLQRLSSRLGFHLERARNDKGTFDIEQDADFMRLAARARPYTLTSLERMYALYEAVQSVSARRLPGAIVECGVWKGGSMSLVAETLVAAGDVERELYLYDTFEGMTAPDERDTDIDGRRALDRMEELQSQGLRWGAEPMEPVIELMRGTGYPMDRVKFVKGDVLDTLDQVRPGAIALLRLDTDWYQSTKKELEVLAPLVSKGGFIIFDDYGHYRGARQAVDEYLGPSRAHHLYRIDYSARMLEVR